MPKLFAVALFLVVLASCQRPLREDRHLLMNLLNQDPRQFQYFMNNKDSLEIQIIYTMIDRDANNQPEFRSFYYNLDSTCYFYPASTVKFPMVLMALEKLKHLHVAGLSKVTPMYHDSVYSGQISVRKDSTFPTGEPSAAHYIKKILVVSDNDAHNRLYEFMGQRAANETMWQKGYTIRLLHRLDRALSPDENRHTEAVCFGRENAVCYEQPMMVNDSISVRQSVLKGKAYVRNDTLFQKPLDFSYKNFYPLSSQQRVLRAFLFPESVLPRERFDITREDRKFVLQYMSQLPTETFVPGYAYDTTYYPAFCKYLMFGNDRTAIPDNIRIFNKVGNAYGYLIDNAYIVDFDNKIEFMLSAVIATNMDQVYGDDRYEYEKIGFPFMKNLGRLIYDYELSRTRSRKPDLSEFRLDYDPETD